MTSHDDALLLLLRVVRRLLYRALLESVDDERAEFQALLVEIDEAIAGARCPQG